MSSYLARLPDSFRLLTLILVSELLWGCATLTPSQTGHVTSNPTGQTAFLKENPKASSAEKNEQLNNSQSTLGAQQIKGVPVSIAMDSDQLSPNYSGDDIVKVYNDLILQAPSKSEYETTDQYLSRINTAHVQDNIYAFKVEGGYRKSSIARYDADSQSLAVLVEFSQVQGQRNKESVIIKITEDREREAIESNAFGATANVYTRSGTTYNIAIDKDEWKISFIHTIKLNNISPEEAKRLKQSISVLAICKPKLSGKSNVVAWPGSYYTAARIDHPIRYSFKVMYINVELLEFWIIDQSSGKVYLKQRW